MTSAMKMPWSRAMVDEAIAQGRSLILYHGKVLDVTDFIQHHPGGRRAIEYVLGMDATEAITVFHPPWVLKYKVPVLQVGVMQQTPITVSQDLLNDSPADSGCEVGHLGSAPALESLLRGTEQNGSWIPARCEDVVPGSVAEMGVEPGSSYFLATAGPSLNLLRRRVSSSELVDPLPGQSDAQSLTESMVVPAEDCLPSLSSSDSSSRHSSMGMKESFSSKSLPLLGLAAVSKPVLTADAMPKNPDLPVNHPRPLPLDDASRDRLVRSYLALNEELRAKGFYEPNIAFYVRRIVLFLVIWGSCMASVAWFPDRPFVVIFSALMLGFVWHGLAFSVHDAGHHAVTANRRLDDLFGVFCASLIGGLSVGWWRANHNVHHIVTNHPEHDPDIQHLPFVAISTRFFYNLYSTFHKRILKFDGIARFMVPCQHYLFLPVLTFGRFNLLAMSWSHQLNMQETDGTEYRYLELTLMGLFWVWYSCLLYAIVGWPWKLAFLYLSHASTVILHFQITLSHFAMSTEDVGPDELFVSKAVRTTMNVDCPAWFDWFHGGLNFQIEHHLFPRLPRCHFRQVQPYVKRFCEENGLRYYSYGFARGNEIVHGVLHEVAQQIAFLIESSRPSQRFHRHGTTMDGFDEPCAAAELKLHA